MFAYTYVLECSDGKLYVGSTIDLRRRIEEHLSGTVLVSCEGSQFKKGSFQAF
jgi:predicted GIY-YIG superfamily endonuclease